MHAFIGHIFLLFSVNSSILVSSFSQIILADLKVISKSNRGSDIWFSRYPLIVLVFLELILNFLIDSLGLILDKSINKGNNDFKSVNSLQ